MSRAGARRRSVDRAVGRLLLAALVVGILWVVVPMVVSVPGRAQQQAQAAADRVLPGALRVTAARHRSAWDGPGYSVSAVLIGDPEVRTGWTTGSLGGCSPGSSCESSIVPALRRSQASTGEERALERAFRDCGLPLTGPDEITGDSAEAITGGMTGVGVILPLGELADTAGATARLDGCLQAWPAQRSALPSVRRHTLSMVLHDPDGTVHSRTTGTVVDGRLTVPTIVGLAPDVTSLADGPLGAAVGRHVREWLARQGLPADAPVVSTARYLPGTVTRLRVYALDARSDASRPQQAVALTVDRDGGRPADLRFVPWRDRRPLDDPALPTAPR